MNPNFPNIPNMVSGYSQDSENNFQEQYLNDVMVILGVFTKDSMELASLYCIHSGRNSVSKKDIEMAMKTRAFHGEAFWNRGDIQQKLLEMRNYLNEEEGGSEEEEEEEEEMDIDDEGNDEEKDIQNFIKSECTCDLCTTLNGIEEKWNTWNPHERMEQSIKHSIDKTFKLDNLDLDFDLE